MKQETINFYKRMLPLTIVMVVLGTFVYGVPVVYIIIRDGIPDTPHLVVTIWGLLMFIGSWYFMLRTIKAYKS